MDAERPLLSHGQFFGSYESRRSVGGFALSLLSPDPVNEVERHTHAEAHFILLLGGSYLSSARGAEGVSVGPTLIYNPPGITHRDRFATRQGRFFGLSISAERLDQARLCVPLIESALKLDRGEQTALAQRLARECHAWEGASPLVAEGLCLELLAQVARRPEPDGKAPPPWLRSAREILRDRCGDELHIADVAQAAGVHPIHLARAFRRFFRCTPGEYLRRCRVERAAALLRDTALPLTEVALSSGFADQSHFSRSFKRAYGVSPREFRVVPVAR